jgi:hypothetical protein
MKLDRAADDAAWILLAVFVVVAYAGAVTALTGLALASWVEEKAKGRT